MSLYTHPCSACGQPVRVSGPRQVGDGPVYCIGHKPQQEHPPDTESESEKAMERFLRSDSNYQTTSAWVNGRDAWRAAVKWMRENAQDEGSMAPACVNCGRTHWGATPVDLVRVGGLQRCSPCTNSYRDGCRDGQRIGLKTLTRQMFWAPLREQGLTHAQAWAAWQCVEKIINNNAEECDGDERE